MSREPFVAAVVANTRQRLVGLWGLPVRIVGKEVCVLLFWLKHVGLVYLLDECRPDGNLADGLFGQIG